MVEGRGVGYPRFVMSVSVEDLYSLHVFSVLATIHNYVVIFGVKRSKRRSFIGRSIIQCRAPDKIVLHERNTRVWCLAALFVELMIIP